VVDLPMDRLNPAVNRPHPASAAVQPWMGLTGLWMGLSGLSNFFILLKLFSMAGVTCPLWIMDFPWRALL
jgi:hypothetical protein